MSDTPERATYSIEEVAKILGIGRSTAFLAVHTGRIPSIRVGSKRMVVPRAALEKMLANGGDRGAKV